MKTISVILSLLALVACVDKSQLVTSPSNVENGSITGLNASIICSGNTIAGITGTANCSEVSASGSVAEEFYVMSSRADNATLPTIGSVLDIDFLTGREVATLKNAMDGSSLYNDNYSVVPRPLDESDGRYAPCSFKGNWNCILSDIPEYPEGRHYLEQIVGQGKIGRQDAINVCGASGSIEARIADCKSVNGNWAFYNGAQYGQVGEGDWSQVIVVDDGGKKYEVWRDERTKLLWSGKADSDYNWYQASGYSKPTNTSERETQFTSEPGVLENAAPWNINKTLQPTNPISVCPDVVDGKIVAGGGHYENYAANPETAFKGNLSFSDNVIWKLPSIDDFKLADVNGIRKVLTPLENYQYWSSTSSSSERREVWYFQWDVGWLSKYGRDGKMGVRCVGFVRER